MSKLLGFCFFVCGVVAVYVWGIRPLTAVSNPMPAAPTAIVMTRVPSATPVAPTVDQRAVASAAGTFLYKWQQGEYASMYAQLGAAAQRRISESRFVARYRAIMAEATVEHVATRVGSTGVDVPAATVAFSVTLSTTAVGQLTQDNTMHLVLEQGEWKIDWYPTLILKGLEDPYVVHLVTLPAHRGSILDRHGTPLAEDGQFVQVGVEPGLINDEKQLLAYLSKWLNLDPKLIKHLYTLSWAKPDYFMPISTVTDYQWKHAPAGLDMAQANGLVSQEVPGRTYPFGSLASILVGYVDPTTGHGRAGLEQSLDSVLAGRDGAELDMTNQGYTMVALTFARRPAVNGQDVRLSIDLREQQALEKAIGTRKGAAAAIDPSSGQVLALVSSPGYDPNRFEIPTATNGIGPVRGMYPRATEGLYPTGSVFKIVTMAAALERGGYQATTLIDGPGVWYGLGTNDPLYDWLPSGHGTITLQEALTQSCDTCFYAVGKDLDGIDENLLPSFARSFGFGAPTGIDHVAEAAGLVPDNAWKEKTLHDAWRTGDTVNLAIGQGYFLATPLQVASMLASVGDHGIVHSPLLVLQIGKTTFTAPVTGKLPVSAAHLSSILQGMLGVSTESTGTAAFLFNSFPWQVAAKTGTAQNTGTQPHAWFAAIAPFSAPKIALAVVLENAGEGSTVAGPVARTALQVYLNEVAPVTQGGAQPLQVPGG